MSKILEVHLDDYDASGAIYTSIQLESEPTDQEIFDLRSQYGEDVSLRYPQGLTFPTKGMSFDETRSNIPTNTEKVNGATWGCVLLVTAGVGISTVIYTVNRLLGPIIKEVLSKTP
ncbi:hypothetical protein AUJ59_03655 [Candidatus Beckwithbacteria bacterium CG1_02_47_37]|uniref:Uncharacterized protein n=1 Tax=Candidatus Beckwithbacteria bacterium CG1_02_47_37 TaxID=1805034 RepID=A0A1J4RNX0_9BACT|nr:MAG: hypothetical protein AUJ59_03655 [Candidatus Beckwithbacteria bacterium CG1_02_47_37]